MGNSRPFRIAVLTAALAAATVIAVGVMLLRSNGVPIVGWGDRTFTFADDQYRIEAGLDMNEQIRAIVISTNYTPHQSLHLVGQWPADARNSGVFVNYQQQPLHEGCSVFVSLDGVYVGRFGVDDATAHGLFRGTGQFAKPEVVIELIDARLNQAGELQKRE